MKAGKRINIIEDTAVSPTERLRLLSVGSTHFIMVSAKGHAPSLVCLDVDDAKPFTQQISGRKMAGESDGIKATLADAMEAHTMAKPFEKSMSNRKLAATGIPETSQDDKQQAFAEKFRSWRQQNEVR
jgi:hypothetical protein